MKKMNPWAPVPRDPGKSCALYYCMVFSFEIQGDPVKIYKLSIKTIKFVV